jgi:hypothetical protein
MKKRIQTIFTKKKRKEIQLTFEKFDHIIKEDKICFRCIALALLIGYLKLLFFSLININIK